MDGLGTTNDIAPATGRHRHPLLIALLVIVALAALLTLIGRDKLGTSPAGTTGRQLSPEEVAQVMKSLGSTEAPKLTPTEQTRVLKSLESKTPPKLTPAEQERVLNSL